MKPEILTIKNIGPFAGIHKIDFTKLGSIFLVCGKTGAGKTTIFDALSYVFYSKPTGSRSGIVRSLRSHFASDEDTSEAELIFSIGQERYRILRRLPFLKLGNKNERPEEVEFSKFENNEWADKTSTNKSETDKKIKELIKLNEKEFSRIVLLPQGEFAEFLKENSNQKKDTLAELFPVVCYSEIMKNAKEKETAVKEHLKILENSLTEMNLQFNPQMYESEKEKLEEELNLIKKNYELFNFERDKKKADLQQALLLAEKLKEHDAVLKELEAINSEDGMIALLQNKIDSAIKARPLNEKAKVLKNTETNAEECQKEIEKIKDNLSYIEKSIEEMQNKFPEIQNDKIKTAELKRNHEMLERAAVLFTELEQGKQKQKQYLEEIKNISKKMETVYANEKNVSLQKEGLQEDIDCLNSRMTEHSVLFAKLNYQKRVKEISENVQRIESGLKTHTAAAENTNKNLKIIEKDYLIEQEELKKLQAEQKEIEQNKKAAVLSADLVPGKPCPVCGSSEHPKPAADDGRSLFSVEEKIEKCLRSLERLQKTKEELSAQYSSLYASAANYSEQLKELNGDFEKVCGVYGEGAFSKLPSSEEIKISIAETSKALERAACLLKKSQNASSLKTSLENKLAQITDEKRKLENDFSQVKISESGIKSAIKEKQKMYDNAFENLSADIKKSNIEDTIEECKNRILFLDRKINSYEENNTEIQRKEAALKAVFAEKEILLKKFKNELLIQKAELAKEMEEYGFESFEFLFEALIPDDEIKRKEEDIKNFTEKKTILKQKLEGLKKDIQNKPITEPEKIKDEIFILEKKLDEETKRNSEVIIEITSLEKLNSQYIKLNKERELCAKNASVIKSLSSDLNGINSQKLKFDIWILSAFLKEITVYANKRLKRMSEGRYVLKVGGEAGGNSLGGLDLEVFDSYTGTCRTTASLSGGETFMASISLALGLADSIQSRNGGIRLESMFIDEGFGSLDEASLENAITILDEIRGNRMVGIISHVSELRTRIPNKIEIEKTGRGSKIKI